MALMPPPSDASLDRLVRLRDGEDIVQALAAATSGAHGWVEAVGALEEVELRTSAHAGDARKRFRGRFTLVALGGPAGGPYGATLSREAGHAMEIVAGHVVAGRVAGVTALFRRLELSDADRSAADERPSSVARVGTVGGPAEPEKAPLPWAAVAVLAAQAKRATGPVDEDEQYPEVGDLVDHFAFGLCDVVISDGENLKIRDRTSATRIREIRVDVLKVLGPTDHEGQRLFKLVRRK
jgi:predicted DNA-binding protein with PD1-like motif